MVKPKLDRRLIRNFDIFLLLTVFALQTAGTLTLYSATHSLEGIPDPLHFVKRQLLFIGVGLALMLLFAFIDYINLKNWAIYFYVTGLLLLGLVLVIGETDKGAMRRIQIGFFDLQPSEIAKVILIIVLAKMLSEKEGQLPYFQDLLPALAATALPMILIFATDLGTSLIFLVVLAGMLLRRWSAERASLLLSSAAAGCNAAFLVLSAKALPEKPPARLYQSRGQPDQRRFSAAAVDHRDRLRRPPGQGVPQQHPGAPGLFAGPLHRYDLLRLRRGGRLCGSGSAAPALLLFDLPDPLD